MFMEMEGNYYRVNQEQYENRVLSFIRTLADSYSLTNSEQIVLANLINGQRFKGKALVEYFENLGV